MTVKKVLVGILLSFACTFAVVAHAEEVDSYFVWEIKNFDACQPYELLFSATSNNQNGVVGMRDMIYWATTYGKYSEAVLYCEMTAAQLKVAFGENYLDENLIELTAKLCLAADEFDKAERTINFLMNNAPDNSTRIRALNLKSDLLNRRGNYAEALVVTKEVDELLRGAPDEKLFLINQSRKARAYCGLGETKNSLELAEKIFPSLESTFGKAGIETLALLSTLAEDYRKAQRYDDCGTILMRKLQTANERYGQNDPVIVAKTVLDLADLGFVVGDTKRGEELLNGVSGLAAKCLDTGNNRASLQLYKALNETATKHLDGNNPVVLRSKLGLARTKNAVGDLVQSIELCEKNLSKFKKAFGEQGGETIALMKTLSEDYLLLGKYADAKKVVDERLTVCKKNFGDSDARTVESVIDSIKLCYKTGKYKTGDKLFDDVVNQNRQISGSNPQLYNEFVFTRATGARMRGSYDDFHALTSSMNASSEENFASTVDSMLEVLKVTESATGGAVGYLSKVVLQLTHLTKIFANEYHPKNLETMTLIAEAYIESGELEKAEIFTQRIFELSRQHFGENNFCEWLSLRTLSKIRRNEGNFSDALTVDKQALKVAEKVCGKNSLERLQSLDSIADDHVMAGNFVEAIKVRERALSEYKNVMEGDDESTLRMMTNLAENYVAAKRYADAVKLCDSTIAMTNDNSSLSNAMNLSRIKATAQKLSGDNSAAAETYMKLIPVYESKRNMVNQFRHLGNAKTNWFAEIIPVYKDAASVAVSDKVDDATFAFYCMEFCKGRSLIDRYNDVLVAKNYLLKDNEKIRLKTYQDLLNSCRIVAESSAAQNDDTLRTNVETVYLLIRMNDEKFKGELRKKYSNNMVPKDPHKRAEAEQKLTSWEEALKNFDVKKTRQAIPNGACLVEFLKVSDDSLLVTFLRNDTLPAGVNISVDKEFFDDCRLYHDLNAYADMTAMHGDGKYLWQVDSEYAITAGRTKPATSAVAINDNAKLNELRQGLSEKLSQKLIPTIETYAGKSSHWIISSDAELNLVPFETLIYRDKMLIESVDVSYVPSLAVMNLMKKRERKNAYLGQSQDLFAMGDAVYSDTDTATSRGTQLEFFNKLRSNPGEEFDITELRWSNLPGTSRELDKVSSLFENKEIFRREQVTEKNLRKLNADGELSKYKYLLFATHGLFVPDKPEISSIVLSQHFNDEETDGYVTVGEWMSFDLRSNLIYLSACESGLGGYQAGEGIVGIPYALTVAGNKDTVMSLWKVDDEATAEFTSAVFEKLSKGKSEVVALNETKREFIKNNKPKYRNPSVWAAFLLYGI